MAEFYTYLWLREDGTPYYVGKGKGRRAFTKSAHTSKPPQDKSRILIQEFPDEDSAFEAEKFFIAYYGRRDQGTGCLRNLTDGGDAPPLHIVVWTEEMRSAARGRKAHLGCKHSSETKVKMRLAKLGRKRAPHTEETRAKIAASNTGFRHSEESRAKMGIASHGRVPWNKGRSCPHESTTLMRLRARQRIQGASNGIGD